VGCWRTGRASCCSPTAETPCGSSPATPRSWFLAFWQLAGHHRDDLGDLDKVRAAVERAIVVAGITCTRVGANPPHLSELPA